MTLVVIDDDAGTRVVARVPQGDARREHRLRDLIYDHPAIVPVHELDPSFGSVFTVAKELSIPGVGFVDVLLADELGRLVVIKCKLWRNPQARREVVGQILDYSRELSRFSYEALQRQISIATRRSGNVLYALAREAGSTLDEARFVDRVSRDLAAGRFLLLVVGDGITEGARRIGEYLRDQPGLAFGFGLVEMAEYRLAEPGGGERLIMQPRLLARTAVIERHVIRSEVPGLVIEAAAPADAEARPRVAGPASDASQIWSRFVERFVAETRFDDPGQPSPRRGGIGWIRVPLPDGLYVNAWRSSGSQVIGTQVRFLGDDGPARYETLLADRPAIDREFTDAGLEAPEWEDGEVPTITLRNPSRLPWDAAAEDAQRIWLGRAANQFVNSIRPRLERMSEPAGA